MWRSSSTRKRRKTARCNVNTSWGEEALLRSYWGKLPAIKKAAGDDLPKRRRKPLGNGGVCWVSNNTADAMDLDPSLDSKRGSKAPKQTEK